MMGRLFRLIVILVALAIVALIGYSYSGLMSPETRDITQPVDLDGD